jgi:formylglycine-generating enzyme required for sulfatase activity
MRPGAWIRRWGPALAALAVPVTGTFFWRAFRSPEPALREVRALAPVALEIVTVPAGLHHVADGTGWRGVTTGAFGIGRTEVTVRQYCEALNRSGAGGRETPQISGAPGAWTPRAGCADQAVAWVTAREAEAFCAWLSAAAGVEVRLPDADEWEIAARAGTRSERADGWRGDAERPARAPAADAPPENAWGLRGIGGGLFEWCREGETRAALDSAWTEPTDAFDAPHRRWSPPPGYCDADTGFRVRVNIPPR